MDQIKVNHPRLIVPSLSSVVFLAIFVSLTCFQNTILLNDGDTGVHIRAGEVILRELRIPSYDPFIFHLESWTAHEWLSEVIMALVHRAFGMTGIVIFFSLLIAWIHAALFKFLFNDAGVLSVLLIWFFAAASTQIHWLARPHLFTLALVLVFYVILESYQTKHWNRLYLLPFLMVLWVNLHGGFVMGLFLLSIYGAGNVVFFIKEKSLLKKMMFKAKLGNITVTLATCVAVSLINPYGFWSHIFPFDVTSRKVLLENIGEFLPTNFRNLILVEGYWLILVLVLARSRIPLNLIEITLILTTAHMAFFSVRHVPIFAVISSPILVRRLDPLLRNVRVKHLGEYLHRFQERILNIDRKSSRAFWPIAGVVLVSSLAWHGRLNFQFNEKKVPLSAIEFLKYERVPGPIFNGYEFGDYLVYYAWSDVKAFIHSLSWAVSKPGQSELANRLFNDYLEVANIKPAWRKVLDKYKINTVFYSANASLSVLLLSQPDWRLIYADQVANIFVRNTAENQELIRKYPNVRPVVAEA